MAAKPTTQEVEMRFVEQVGRILAVNGWVRRDVNGFPLGSFTKAVNGGMLAVAGLRPERISLSAHGEDVFEVQCGVGYEPALDLMPILSLDPHPMLVAELEDTDHEAFTVNPERDATAATPEQVAGATERAIAFAATFADPRAVYAAMVDRDRRHVEERRRYGNGDDHEDDAEAPSATMSTEGSAEVGEPGSSVDGAVDIRRRLVMLASMRDLDGLHVLMTAHENAPSRWADKSWSRFERQLHRWLDAGAPVAPPLAETMARLPHRRRLQRVSWSASRARSRAERDARKAAAAAAGSDDPAEIAALPQAQIERRGLNSSPMGLAMGVQVIRDGRHPLGRLRSAVVGVKTIASMVSGFVHQVKQHFPDPPDWLLPPPRACYEVPRGQSATAVHLDAAARNFVERAMGTGRRVGPVTMVQVWLTRDPDNEHSAFAFIGVTRVGSVSVSAPFDKAVRAAEFYDEDPVIEGLLWRLKDSEPIALQVADPDYE